MNILEAAKKLPHGISVISEWLGSGGIVVPSEVSQARADVCTGRTNGKKCPNNDQSFSPTGPVALAIKKYLSVKNRIGLRVIGERQLGTCSVCTCNLRLLIHEPQEKVKAEMTEEESKSLPKFCWKLWL